MKLESHRPSTRPRPGGARRASRTTLLAAALLASGAAQAVLQPSLVEVDGELGAITASGDLNRFLYGAGGMVYDLRPMLSVNLLGSPASPQEVAGRNVALQFGFSSSGVGTNLLTLAYEIRNLSSSESFQDLRFMVYANPDGSALDFQDVVTEQWGAKAARDPDRRAVRAFDSGDLLLGSFAATRELADAAPAGACAAAGCDATLGMQWNTATLGPNQMLRVRIGLSDDGSALSSRWLLATAAGDPGSALTLSGTAEVLAVPEPGIAAMLAVGLEVLALRRRQLSSQA